MPGLMFTVGANNAQAIAAFSQTLAAANAQGKIITQTLDSAAGGQRHWNGVIREGLVLVREMSRGNWTRVPGSASLFVQRLNDQLPFLAAIATPLAGALLAVGAAAAYLALGLKKMADEAEKENKAIGTLPTLLNRTAEAMDAAAKRAEDYSDWLQKLSNHHDTLSESTEESLRLMREEFTLQQKLADERGQTPQNKAKAEIEQQKRELSFITDQLNKAKEVAAHNLEVSNRKEKEANNLDEEAHNKAERDNLKVLEDRMKEAGKAPGTGSVIAHAVTGTLAQEEVNRLSKFAVAQQEYNDALKNVSLHETLQRRKEKEAKDRKEIAGQSQSDVDRLEKLAKTKDADLGLAEKYKSSIAEEGRKQLLRGHVNALQAIGAYTPPSQVTMVDIAKRSEKHLAAIAKAVAKGGGSGGKKGTF
jgi:hypothetical protein